MSSSLDKNQTRRGRWKTESNSKAHESELYQKVFSRYEAWINQLVDETEKLKEFLTDICEKLANLSKKCENMHLGSAGNKDAICGSPTSSIFLPEVTKNGVFSINFCLGREQIQKNFDDHFYVIEQALEFNLANRIEEGAESCAFDVEAEFIAEGLCVEQKAQLLDQHRKLQEERKMLKQEREKFANAAIRLNREKAEFELEKVELLKQQFLNELPPQPSIQFSEEKEKDSVEISDFHNFLDEATNENYVVPFITTPKGIIRQMDTPTFLGPISFRSPLKTNHRKSRTSSCTTEDQSAPNSRPPSWNRNSSDHGDLQRNYRSLETRGRSSDAGVRTDDHLSYTYPRLSALDISSAEASPSTRKKNLRMSNPFRESCADYRDDLYSLDSGFDQDREESDVKVGKRLTVLENSLVSLLNKIEAKRDFKKGSSRRDSPHSSNDERETPVPRGVDHQSRIVNKENTNSPKINKRIALSRPSLPAKLISAPSKISAIRKRSLDKNSIWKC